jgi:hypothetical protein
MYTSVRVYDFGRHVHEFDLESVMFPPPKNTPRVILVNLAGNMHMSVWFVTCY